MDPLEMVEMGHVLGLDLVSPEGSDDGSWDTNVVALSCQSGRPASRHDTLPDFSPQVGRLCNLSVPVQNLSRPSTLAGQLISPFSILQQWS
jgi:hypothetical protein